MNITEEQYQTLIATLALIDATDKTNGKLRLGLDGAEEAFDTIQEFIRQWEQT
jgi:hypothetical protein